MPEFSLSPTLSFEKVTKVFYPEVVALQDFTLDVRPGEIVAVVGPSGCGKTTLLRLAAGLERPDHGEVYIGGRRVAAPGVWLPPEKRSVGLVFQDYALFPHMTVANNIVFGIMHLPKQERLARLEELLMLVSLADKKNNYPHELSGGERQRVALVRAMAPRPAILLLDEPFSNLDYNLRYQVRDEIANILKQVGSTVLFVTHEQNDALEIGDKVVVLMSDGKLEQHGTPHEIFHHPRTRFVAEFLGPTDFVSGIITRTGIRLPWGHLSMHVDLPPGTPVDVAVRPDDIDFIPDPQGTECIVGKYFKGIANLYRIRVGEYLVHSWQSHTLDLPLNTRGYVNFRHHHDLPYFPCSLRILPVDEVAHISPHERSRALG